MFPTLRSPRRCGFAINPALWESARCSCVTFGHLLAAYPANNTLVISDYAENIQRLGRIIESIDVPHGDVQVLPIHHASAIDLGATIVRLLGDTAATIPGNGTAGAPTAVPGDGSQRVQIVPDARTNSLLVRSDNPSKIAAVRQLVANLDVPGAGGNFHVVYLKNAEAARVAHALRALLAGKSGNSPGSVPSPAPAAPTSAPAASLPALSDGRLRPADPEGSLWKGKGRLFLVTANGTIHPLGPISWSFSSAGLTALEASWRIEGKRIGADSAWIGPRRFGFREFQLSLPASVALAPAGHHGLAPGLHGDLAITVGKLGCPWPRQAGVCDLQAMAHWKRASHDALAANTLADYQFALDAKAGTLQVSWSTIAGRPESGAGRVRRRPVVFKRRSHR